MEIYQIKIHSINHRLSGLQNILACPKSGKVFIAVSYQGWWGGNESKCSQITKRTATNITKHLLKDYKSYSVLK